MDSGGIRGTERNPKTGWRRGWDSNPRDPFGPNGFQDRRFQPLTHPSAFQFNWRGLLRPTANSKTLSHSCTVLECCNENNLVHSNRFQVYKVRIWAVKTGTVSI